MGSRLSIVAGLAAGMLVAVGILAGFVLVGPAPTVPPPSASPSASPSQVAAASPSTNSTPRASASPSGSPDASGSQAANFHIGEPAPALAIPQVSGGTINLAVLRGQPVWVNFMQTTCEPCLEEFPRMNGFAARYAETGLVIIAVDIGEDEGVVAAFADRLNATFPLGLDVDGAAQRAWGAYALPVHFWVDKEGIVRDGALGGIGPDVMARGLGTILPGVEVTP